MRKTRLLKIAGMLAAMLLLNGCGMNSRNPLTYETARAQTKEAMQEIVDHLPADAEVTPRPEQQPYSCSDPVGVSHTEGQFFTDNWDVALPANFDVPSFIAALPEKLGDDWTVHTSQIPTSYATVELTQVSTGTSVTVDQVVKSSTVAIDILGVSPCAQSTRP